MKCQNKTNESFSYENETNEENNSDFESADGDHQGNFCFLVRPGLHGLRSSSLYLRDIQVLEVLHNF